MNEIQEIKLMIGCMWVTVVGSLIVLIIVMWNLAGLCECCP